MKSPLPPRADRPDLPATSDTAKPRVDIPQERVKTPRVDIPQERVKTPRVDHPSAQQNDEDATVHQAPEVSASRQIQEAAATDAPPPLAEDATVKPSQGSRKQLRIRYLMRRATHSSRALTTVIVLLLLMAAAIFLVVEAIVEMSGYRAVVSPTRVAQILTTDLASLEDWILWLGGGIAVVLGLFLIIKALAPGSLSRHGVAGDRYALVVEDTVVAAGISRVVRKAAQLRSGQVKTSVSKRRITVQVTPTSGVPVDRELLLAAAQQEVEAAGLKPKPRINLTISNRGEVQP